MFWGSFAVTSETFLQLFHVLCSLQMRKILRNHFGNASQNGLCLSGNCRVREGVELQEQISFEESVVLHTLLSFEGIVIYNSLLY